MLSQLLPQYLLSVISFEATLFGAMVQLLLDRSASQVWYLSDRKETHAKKTLALANITSQFHQVTIKASDERDYTIFIDRGDCLNMGTMHCAVATVTMEA